jgi:hypothetical protein
MDSPVVGCMGQTTAARHGSGENGQLALLPQGSRISQGSRIAAMTQEPWNITGAKVTETCMNKK